VNRPGVLCFSLGSLSMSYVSSTLDLLLMHIIVDCRNIYSFCMPQIMIAVLWIDVLEQWENY
jgi:hypothetical protein